METLEYFLPQVWFVILILFLFLYVMLDGFDLGVGILSLTSSTEERRSILMTSLSNVWDANETWLVLLAGALFGAFPRAYSTILSALYIPIMVMIFGLIFRAVAFEFREHSKRKLLGNLAFGIGSLLAALGQGFALGGMLEGITVDGVGHFTGTPWEWLSWQSAVVCLTLIMGYVMIGSTYLIMKTEGALQNTYYRTAKIAALGTLGGIIFVIVITPLFSANAMDRFFELPQFFIFSTICLIGVAMVWQLLLSIDRKSEALPFTWTILILLLLFIVFAIVVFPYIIPDQVTIYQAAAASSSLVFMLIFIGFMIPVMVFYNVYQYIVFRGKITGTA